MMGLAGSGSIIFGEGSISISFVADFHGGVASLPLSAGVAPSISGMGVASVLLSCVPFLAVLAGADSEACEFWEGAGMLVWWGRLHFVGVALFLLGVGAASS